METDIPYYPFQVHIKIFPVQIEKKIVETNIYAILNKRWRIWSQQKFSLVQQWNLNKITRETLEGLRLHVTISPYHPRNAKDSREILLAYWRN